MLNKSHPVSSCYYFYCYDNSSHNHLAEEQSQKELLDYLLQFFFIKKEKKKPKQNSHPIQYIPEIRRAFNHHLGKGGGALRRSVTPVAEKRCVFKKL